jgi:preprotein translocase subunit SecE
VAKVSPGEFVRQVQAETKKVTWPTRKETIMTTVMVLIMTTMLGVFFFGIDLVFSKVRELVFSLLV